MNPFSQLTQTDFDMIHYRTYHNCSAEYLLRFWNNNKQKLFELLDNQLIYSTQIEYSRSDEDTKTLIHQQLLDTRKFVFWYDYCALIAAFNRTEYDNAKISQIVNLDSFDRHDMRFYADLLEQLQYDIALNEVRLYEWYWGQLKGAPPLIMPNGKPLNIVKGMRTMRVLKQLAEGFNLRGFEEFRIAHSQFHNDKVVQGTFCLSIHPLDFMTMSDNCEDWDSCMSWDNDGEYKQGTIEMMNSPYIVCGYITSGHNTYNIGDNEWNSKRWRCLYLVHPQAIIAIRNYPWHNDEVSKFGLNILRDFAIKHNYGEYNDMVERFSTTTGNVKYEYNTWCIPFKTNYMYNDLHNSLGYKAPIMNISDTINFSGENECISCGETFPIYEEFAYSLECPSCAGAVFCAHCNCVIRDGDDIYTTLDGECICSYCFNESYTSCMNCCETIALFHEHTYSTVYLTYQGEYIDTPELCSYCCTECLKHDDIFFYDDKNKKWCVDIRNVAIGDLIRCWGYEWWEAREVWESYRD